MSKDLVSSNKFLPEMLSASIEELKELLWSKPLNAPEVYYANILISYLGGQTSQLAKLVEGYECEAQLFHQLSLLRLHIREHQKNDQIYNSLLSWVDLPNIEKGELSFVCALYAEHVLKDLQQAKKLYLNAHKHLAEAVPKKALKSLFNHLACESQIRPRKRFLTDLQKVRISAIRVGSNEIAGLCSLAVSHELYRMGGYSRALAHVEDALVLLEKHRDLRHFSTAAAQRCLCLIRLKRNLEAETALTHLETSVFSQVRNGALVLSEMLDGRVVPEGTPLSTYWELQLKRFRVEKKRGQTKRMTQLEALLFDHVYQTPASKRQIVEHLYGSAMPYEYTEKRFFDLIARFKKKYPGLISQKNKIFSIHEKPYLSNSREWDLAK